MAEREYRLQESLFDGYKLTTGSIEAFNRKTAAKRKLVKAVLDAVKD